VGAAVIGCVLVGPAVMLAWPVGHDTAAVVPVGRGVEVVTGQAPDQVGAVGPVATVAATAAQRATADASPRPGPGGQPVRVRIAAAGVDAAVSAVGVAADGALEVPATADDVGWLDTSAVPGRIGPAVLAGHVDGTAGPAVFTRLADLRPGDDVSVDLADGTTVRFRVASTQRVAKDAFPTQEVYGPSPTPQLRLVTCGGQFDRGERSYRDNVIVTAVPVEV
jgi:LPXTG-site transpeptidase (sortase) family protein